MEYKVKIVRTLEELAALELHRHEKLVADVETYGKRPEDGKLLGIALAPLEGRFADGSDAAYVVCQEYLYHLSQWDKNPDWREGLEETLCLQLVEKKLIGYN